MPLKQVTRSVPRELHEADWGCQAGTPTLLLAKGKKKAPVQRYPKQCSALSNSTSEQVFHCFSSAGLPLKKFHDTLQLQEAPWEGSFPHYKQGQATNRKLVRKDLSAWTKLP